MSHETVKLDATFQGDPIIAMLPIRAYSDYMLVVVERWDAEPDAVVWITGVLNRKDGTLKDHAKHDFLQDALQNFAGGVIAASAMSGITALIITRNEEPQE